MGVVDFRLLRTWTVRWGVKERRRRRGAFEKGEVSESGKPNPAKERRVSEGREGWKGDKNASIVTAGVSLCNQIGMEI
jgi:hypothetical protein